MNLPELARKAANSKTYRFLFNQLLKAKIPFNRPHHLQVSEITQEYLCVELPYRRRNFNHIKGIHACALATLCEFTSGLLLSTRLDPSRYRIILKKMEMDYHWQAKSKVSGEFEINEEWLQANILLPLQEYEKVEVNCRVKVHDKERRHIATGVILWQIKAWSAARVKI